MVLCKKYGTALQLNPACCIQEKHTCEGLNDESDIRSSRLERIDNLRKPKSRKFLKILVREFLRIAMSFKSIILLRFKRSIDFKI